MIRSFSLLLISGLSTAHACICHPLAFFPANPVPGIEIGYLLYRNLYKIMASMLFLFNKFYNGLNIVLRCKIEEDLLN